MHHSDGWKQICHSISWQTDERGPGYLLHIGGDGVKPAEDKYQGFSQSVKCRRPLL